MVPRFFSFHYTLRQAQGAVLDTSRGGAPVDCLEGGGQIIDGLESELLTMQPGETRRVVVPPERGYGLRDDALVQKVPRSAIPVDDIKVGDTFQTGPDRSDPVVTVRAIEGNEILLDANHPMAGQTLHFEVELVATRTSTPAERKAVGLSS